MTSSVHDKKSIEEKTHSHSLTQGSVKISRGRVHVHAARELREVRDDVYNT